MLGLFLGRNGRRYEHFTALPTVTKKLLNVKINVTDWRKIIATASAEYLKPEEVDIMNRADTHSSETAKRYYQKADTTQNASKAVNLIQVLYDRMNITTPATSAVPLVPTTPNPSMHPLAVLTPPAIRV